MNYEELVNYLSEDNLRKILSDRAEIKEAQLREMISFLQPAIESIKHLKEVHLKGREDLVQLHSISKNVIHDLTGLKMSHIKSELEVPHITKGQCDEHGTREMLCGCDSDELENTAFFDQKIDKVLIDKIDGLKELDNYLDNYPHKK